MGHELLALVKLGVLCLLRTSIPLSMKILHVLKDKSDVLAAPMGFSKGKLLAVFVP